METNSSRITQIDSLRGLAIFLVVLGHSIIVYPINLHENILWKTIFDFISTVHLPLFYMISGYCFSYKTNYKNYIIKKIKRIILPFLFFNSIDLFMRTILPMFVNQRANIYDYLLNIVKFGGPYQFLYILFIIFVIFPLISKLNRKKEFSVITAFVLFLLNYVRLPSIFCVDLVAKYLFFFNLGNIINIHYANIFNYKNKTIESFVLLIVWFILFCLKSMYSLKTLSILTSLFGILTCYFFASNEYFNKIFSNYGKYSLQIYLIDGFALTVSRTVICKITSLPIIIVLFNMFCDFFVVYVCIKWIMSKSKFIRFLLGA